MAQTALAPCHFRSLKLVTVTCDHIPFVVPVSRWVTVLPGASLNQSTYFKINKTAGAGHMGQLAEHLSSMPDAWVSSSARHKPDMEAHACNSGTQKVEAGGLGVQSHAWLHSELKSSIGLYCIGPCLKERSRGGMGEGKGK